jgi:membrane-associated phospholipid phosphatase
MQNAMIDITVTAFLVVAVLLGACALFSRGALAVALLVAGLLALLAGLAVAVHIGWVAGLDATVASWFDTHRSQWFDASASVIFRFIGPAPVAAAGVICGALLSWHARSVIPAVVVIGTVGAAAMAENALKGVVERAPWTAAESLYIPKGLLQDGQHSFPSGHVTGVATLLGMVAVCVGAGRSRAVQAAFAGLVVAGVLFIGFIVLYVFAHCFSDVIGGMVLGAASVTLGAAVLSGLIVARRRSRSMTWE